ncbi:MAG: hypothetical protein MK135_12585, partial [Polyangiaceae bacterium]|nr:hypothetical protein [Polyangiaceae bacterium]
MESSPLFIALDASSTSVRVVIFHQDGQPLSQGRCGLDVLAVGEHGFEQDALSWWTASKAALQLALQPLSLSQKQALVSLTILHQRETVVVTDAVGTPLAPAIMWKDDRCRQELKVAERRVGRVRLHTLSGKPVSTTPSLYKLMYLLKERPELRDVAHIHDVHSFLSLKLTGRAVASFPSADATGMLDMRKKTWADSLIDLIGTERHQLPELVEVGYLIGPLTPKALLETGLPNHLLIYAGSGDAQAAGLGAGIIEQGHAFAEIGTALTCGVHTETYEVDEAFRTLFAAIPGLYCCETTVRSGMSTLYWLVEKVLASEDRLPRMKELEEEALQLPAGSQGLVALPYWSGVMNPFWDETARGVFLGLNAEHSPAHLFRALL